MCFLLWRPRRTWCLEGRVTCHTKQLYRQLFLQRNCGHSCRWQWHTAQSKKKGHIPEVKYIPLTKERKKKLPGLSTLESVWAWPGTHPCLLEEKAARGSLFGYFTLFCCWKSVFSLLLCVFLIWNLCWPRWALETSIARAWWRASVEFLPNLLALSALRENMMTYKCKQCGKTSALARELSCHIGDKHSKSMMALRENMRKHKYNLP